MNLPSNDEKDVDWSCNAFLYAVEFTFPSVPLSLAVSQS